MGLSRLAELPTTGIAAIDKAHHEIERLSRRLLAAFESEIPFDEVQALYEDFRDLTLRHLDFEEALLERLMQRDPKVARHLARHRDNHKVLRDAFAYTDVKFAEPGRTELPAIVPLLPGKYLEQLADLDEEMAKLL